MYGIYVYILHIYMHIYLYIYIQFDLFNLYFVTSFSNKNTYKVSIHYIYILYIFIIYTLYIYYLYGPFFISMNCFN